jgi:hypothetical protein
MPDAIMALTIAAVERTGQKSAFTASWWMTSPGFYERHRGGGCEDSCKANGREQSLALPKTNVADTTVHSAGRAVPRWERICADAQKEVKRHDY